MNRQRRNGVVMSNDMQGASPTASDATGLKNRWVQIGIGIVCMGLVANLQYGWTLFVNPIDAKHHWGKSAIQIAFSIFVFTETWLVPIEAWFVDRYSPQMVIAIGRVLVAGAFGLNGLARSLFQLYTRALL